MKMLTKVLLGITLSTATLGAAVGGAVLSSNHNENNVEVAEAAASDGYVYVDISATSSYTSGVWCHNWGTKGTTWPGTKMTLLQGNIYYCKLADSSNNKVIFNNNNGKQTGNLDFNSSASGRLFYMDSDTAAHADDKTRDQMDFIVGSSSTPSSSTTRLFVHHDDCSNWKSNSSVTRIRCWGSSSYLNVVDGYVYDLSWTDSGGDDASGDWYGYADVPADITGWQLIRTSSYAREIWNRCDGNVTGSFSSRIWRLSENGWNFSWNASTGDSASGVNLMKTILAAIDTCSSSAINGYGAYSALNSNFYSTATASAKAATCRSLGGTTDFTVQTHFEKMAARPGSLPGSNYVLFNTAKNDISVILIAVSVISGIALTGFGLYFFKKRKSVSK